MIHLDYINQKGETCYYGYFKTIELAKTYGRFLIKTGRAIRWSIR